MNKTIHELNEISQVESTDEMIVYDISDGTSKKVKVGKIANSYSTTEQKTGGTWIDGKPIYRCVLTGLSFGAQANSWSTITGTDTINSVIDTLTKAEVRRSSDNSCLGNFNLRKGTQRLEYYIFSTYTACDQIIIEYTKTTG